MRYGFVKCKNKTKITAFISVTALAVALSTFPVFAGGMPDIPPPEERTLLDEALLDIQGIGSDTSSKENEVVSPVSLSPEDNIDKQEVDKVKAVEPIATEISNDDIKEQEATATTTPKDRVVSVQPNSSFFGLSVGFYDAFTHDKLTTSFNMEYQAGVRVIGVLQPIFGAMITTQGTVYGYGGVGAPIDVTDRIFLMPSIAVGGYSEGDGYDLQESIAYRVGTELGWKLKNNSRISLNAHVITNGKSLDRKDRTEVIGISYTTPLQFLDK